MILITKTRVSSVCFVSSVCWQTTDAAELRVGWSLVEAAGVYQARLLGITY